MRHPLLLAKPALMTRNGPAGFATQGDSRRPMLPFTALLDAPTGGKRFQIAAIGDYNDSRYGEFSITADDVADWQKNLSQLPGAEALIDFEHRSERKPRDSKAAGWITGIELDGDKVMADARWTPDGEKAIKDGTYRFVSPAYGSMTNEHGVTFENTLMSVALTNKPALTGMPAVVLASEERVSEAAGEEIVRLLEHSIDGDLELDELQTARLVMLSVTAADRKKAKKAGNSLPDGSYPINNASQLHSAAVLASSKHGNYTAAKALIKRRAKEMGVDLSHLPGMGAGTGSQSADSRQHDMDTAALIKLLDLSEDADEATILDAAEALKAKAAKRAKKTDEPVDTKTLEQAAADEGKIVLDQATWEKTERRAKAGDLAMKRLHQQDFDNAFDNAVRGRKATPGEKDILQALYKADSENTLKMLEARQPVMPDKPSGAPSIEFDPAAPDNFDADSAARAGVAPDSVMLDAQMQKYMHANNIPMSQYGRVLDQAVNGEITL